MKIKLDKEEKAALLVAVSKGELDTAKIPRLYKEIKGNNEFLDLLKQLDADEDVSGWQTAGNGTTFN